MEEIRVDFKVMELHGLAHLQTIRRAQIRTRAIKEDNSATIIMGHLRTSITTLNGKGLFLIIVRGFQVATLTNGKNLDRLLTILHGITATTLTKEFKALDRLQL